MTLISKEYKFIFLHIQKTAGSTIQDALLRQEPNYFLQKNFWRVSRLLGFKAQTYFFYRTKAVRQNSRFFLTLSGHPFLYHLKMDLPGEVFENYYKFSFVRNPWDRVVSIFTYAQQLGFYKDMSFRDFALDESQARVQIKKISDPDGNLLADFVGRVENLRTDFQQVIDHCGLPITADSLGHLNATERRPYRDYYDNETREAVALHYRDDIEAFGYEF